MEENIKQLQNQLQGDPAIAEIMKVALAAGMEGIQDYVDPKVMGIRTSTWKKVGWGAAAMGAVAVVGYGAYKFFGEDGGTVTDGTSGAPCF